MFDDGITLFSAGKNVTGHTSTGLSPRSRLSDEIANKLGVDIVGGLYGTGEAIPTEVELTKLWGVSRTAVREGLSVILGKGLLETRTRGGTRVTNRSRWNLLDPQVLTWMRQAEPDVGFIRSVLELRLILEPQAAALAARRRSVDDLGKLRQALDVMGDSRRTEEAARRGEAQFHRSLVLAAANQTLVPLIGTVEAGLAWTNSYKASRGVSVRESIALLERICIAIAQKDAAEAKWLTEVHIKSSYEYLPDPDDGRPQGLKRHPSSFISDTPDPYVSSPL